MKIPSHPLHGIGSALALGLIAWCPLPAQSLPAPAAMKTTPLPPMHGYVQNIDALTLQNQDFRRVVYTAVNSQLVLMALKPQEEIGSEVHKLDQFFRIEEGTGQVVLDGVTTAIHAGFAVVVPAGTTHNIINTGTVAMKLYTIYSPPNHRDGVVHHTRADALADHEHFDGKTTK